MTGQTLKQDEQALVEELRENGPLLGAQIREAKPKVGFGRQTLESLVERGLAVQVSVKGNTDFFALRVGDSPTVAATS